MTCTVLVAPEVVDSGATLTLKCAVSSTPARDLRGQRIVIKDEGGAEVGNAELCEFTGEANKTDEFTVPTPVKAGAYTWSAVLMAEAGEDEPPEEISTPFSFEVKAHTTSVVVWDVPSAIVVGESFAIKVGIKCSTECGLGGREFGIYDHEGCRVAKGKLAAEPWERTAAMYPGEVLLVAPDAEGLFQWMAGVEECDLDVAGSEEMLPHAAGSATFGVRVVARPQHVVRVEVFDGEKQTPMPGARIIMHPYRATTDENGVAELRVAEGRYQIFASYAKCITVTLAVDVTGDFSTRTELYIEPIIERD